MVTASYIVASKNKIKKIAAPLLTISSLILLQCTGNDTFSMQRKVTPVWPLDVLDIKYDHAGSN